MPAGSLVRPAPRAPVRQAQVPVLPERQVPLGPRAPLALPQAPQAEGLPDSSPPASSAVATKAAAGLAAAALVTAGTVAVEPEHAPPPPHGPTGKCRRDALDQFGPG